MDPTQRQTLTEGVIVLEFAVIVVLVWAMSLEYRANQYLQAWTNANAPFLGYLLNGYLAAMLAGASIGSVALFVQNRPSKRGKRASPNST